MKALEALKRLKQETCPATYMPDFNKIECCDIVEKALKALDIINKKNVWVYHLKQCNSLEEYNNEFIDELHITQEEYDLLKEVLL